MESVASPLPAWACLTSLVAAVLILYCGERRSALREACTLSAAIVKLTLVLWMLPIVLSGKVVTFTVCEFLPELPIAFRVDVGSDAFSNGTVSRRIRTLDRTMHWMNTDVLDPA